MCVGPMTDSLLPGISLYKQFDLPKSAYQYHFDSLISHDLAKEILFQPVGAIY